MVGIGTFDGGRADPRQSPARHASAGHPPGGFAL